MRISKPFAIGRYEVTFNEYDLFAKAAEKSLPYDGGWGRGRRPVINVSWADAREYVEWLAEQTGKRYRLPSEAEWEYAARSGGKEEMFAGTSDERNVGEYAVINSTREPVGTKAPNGLGLYDMSGNVEEWVEDCWHENYNGAPTDGRAWLEENGGDCGQRVWRGGSWSSPCIRSSYRSKTSAGDRFWSLGFRVARDLN